MTAQSDPSNCGSALTALDSRSRANTKVRVLYFAGLDGRTAECRGPLGPGLSALPHSARVVSTKAASPKEIPMVGSPGGFSAVFGRRSEGHAGEQECYYIVVRARRPCGTP